MRVPWSWVREYVDLPAGVTASDAADRLTHLGLKLEELEPVGAVLAGPLVVGRITSYADESPGRGRVIRWCQVDVGEERPRGIVCGATNFDRDDLVVVALPGTVLPEGRRIDVRRAYGHDSDGMVCSPRELGVGDDHTGILVLPAGIAQPGDDAAELLHLRDEVIELEITPDRGYALSLRGVARELATAYDVPFHDPAGAEPVAADEPAGHPARIEDPSACDRFVLASVGGIDPSVATPWWLRRRLQLGGMRPVSLAVDVTNYVMLELGQPLHAFAADRLTGEVAVRRARPGERLETLDHVTRDLDPDDICITDQSGAISLAGTMGGLRTEIGAGSTDVVIEAAHFDPAGTARMARRHRLASEASRRFERGVDPALPPRAADRAVRLLVELAGGTARGRSEVDVERAPVIVALPAGHAAAVSGVQRADDLAADRLTAVGCTVRPAAGGYDVTPPSWRPDLREPNDLVEEVIRLVGYDAVPSALPTAPAGPGLTNRQRMHRRVGYALAGAGLVEVLSYPFVGPPDWAALGLAEDDPRRSTRRLINPLSEEQPELTTTLLPGLLRTAARNVGRGLDDVALFELGRVFRSPPDRPLKAPLPGADGPPDAAELAAMEAALPWQPRHLGVVLCGDRLPGGWWGPGRPVAWADAVAALRLAAATCGVQLTVRADSLAPWHPGRCAELQLAGEPVGHAGELHPRLCQTFGLPSRTVAGEIDVDAVVSAAPELARAPRVTTYPLAKADVALVVEAGVPAARVEEALRSGAGGLLESLRLFDVYTGPQVPPGYRSLAYALRFRAPDRTLTDHEVAAAREAAVAEAARTCGAVLRGG